MKIGNDMTQTTIDLSESDQAMIHLRAKEAIESGEDYYNDLDYAIECEWRYFEDELAMMETV
jgi:hypothetical protein